MYYNSILENNKPLYKISVERFFVVNRATTPLSDRAQVKGKDATPLARLCMTRICSYKNDKAPTAVAVGSCVSYFVVLLRTLNGVALVAFGLDCWGRGIITSHPCPDQLVLGT